MYLVINPIALSLGILHIHWYGIILGVGTLLGLLIAIREGRRFSIDSDFFIDMLYVTLPSQQFLKPCNLVFYVYKKVFPAQSELNPE